MEQLILY